MSTTETNPPRNNPVVEMFWGGLLGCVGYALATLALLAAASRRAENIRHVIDLPWPVFAILPSVLAFGLLMIAVVWFPTWRARLNTITSFSAAVGVCTWLAIELLHRFTLASSDRGRESNCTGN